MPPSQRTDLLYIFPLIGPHLQVSEELLMCSREKEQLGQDCKVCVCSISSKHKKKVLWARQNERKINRKCPTDNGGLISRPVFLNLNAMAV